MSGRTRVGVAAAGLTVLGLLAAGCGGGGDEAAGTPKVEVSGASESSAHAGHHMLKARQNLSVPEITEQGARGEILEAFWDYYRVQVQTQHKMDPVLPEYASAMVGEALTTHSQLLSKYNRQHRDIYGAPVITGVEVLSYQGEGADPQAVVGACVDTTNWVALKRSRPARPSDQNEDYTRVGVAKVSGAWKVYDKAIESRDQGRCS
jgi:hypothetical protein